MIALPSDFEGLLAHLNEQTLDPDVDARDLHATLGCRVPFGLWLHNEITSIHDEGDEWLPLQTPFGKSALLTRETALWAAQRINSPLGNRLLSEMGMRFQAAMRVLRSQPGNEDLDTLEGMFASIKAHAEERERFQAVTGRLAA